MLFVLGTSQYLCYLHNIKIIKRSNQVKKKYKEQHKGFSSPYLIIQYLKFKNQFQIAWYSFLSDPLYSHSETEYVSKYIYAI